MKSLVVFFVVFISMNSNEDISQIRQMYRYAVDSEENTEEFYQFTQKTNYAIDNVMAGYYGCALVLKASIEGNIFDKISFFRKGKNLIEEAVKSEPYNIELRMIRLSIQINVPIILRYSQNIEEDKKFIIQNIDKVSSPDLKKIMTGFMASPEVIDA